MDEWSPLATSRYQDHVIAHIVGATALGYFIIDDAAYVLLNIALIWTIYTSGEMTLMTQAATIDDLEIEESLKAELLADVERLHQGKRESLTRMRALPIECLISGLNIYEQDERRRVLVEGEGTSLVIESSVETGEIRVLALEEN